MSVSLYEVKKNSFLQVVQTVGLVFNGKSCDFFIPGSINLNLSMNNVIMTGL